MTTVTEDQITELRKRLTQPGHPLQVLREYNAAHASEAIAAVEA